MIGALVGCVAAARTVAASGGGAIVTDGLVLHLDPASYSSGQVWANSVTGPADGAAQTAYDYHLGSTSSADSNDPTHSSSYWAFDGDDYFTAAAAATTFIKGMHKDGAVFTIEAWWYRGAAGSNVNPIWDSGTSDQGGSDMSRGVIFADQGSQDNPEGRWGVRIKRDSGGGTALNVYLNSAPALDAWHHHAVSFTGAANSFLWLNGAIAACNLGSTTWDGTLSSPGTSDPTNPARIGARGDVAFHVGSGNRLGMLRIYNRALSSAELLQNWNAERAGFVGTSSGHRYWRWSGISLTGSYFEISELRVVDGSGTRYAATMTASTAPDFGTLASLADGSTSTRTYWDAATATAGGFWIQADLGLPYDVAGMQMASYDTSDRYPSAVTLQWSDDGSSWTTFGTWSGLTYPGNNAWGPVLTPAQIDVTDPDTVAYVIDINGTPTVVRYSGTTYQYAGASEVTSAASFGEPTFISNSNSYSAILGSTEISIFSDTDYGVGQIRYRTSGGELVETNAATEFYPLDDVSGGHLYVWYGFTYGGTFYLIASEHVGMDVYGPFLYTTLDGLSATKVKSQGIPASAGGVTRIGNRLFATTYDYLMFIDIPTLVGPTPDVSWSSTGIPGSQLTKPAGYGSVVVVGNANDFSFHVSQDYGNSWTQHFVTSYTGIAIPTICCVSSDHIMVKVASEIVIHSPTSAISFVAEPISSNAYGFEQIVGADSTFVAVGAGGGSGGMWTSPTGVTWTSV